VIARHQSQNGCHKPLASASVGIFYTIWIAVDASWNGVRAANAGRELAGFAGYLPDALILSGIWAAQLTHHHIRNAARRCQ
jgi:hypothetical protein